MRRSRASQLRCPRPVGAWRSSSSRKGFGATRSPRSPGPPGCARAAGDGAYEARRDGQREPRTPRAFADGLERGFERARRYGHGLTLVFFDVDDFKLVNDTYGHPEGDRVLRVVAHLIRERLRRSDLAGRMGGDEFAVVLIESDIEAGGHFLARIGDGIDECIARSELPAGFS